MMPKSNRPSKLPPELAIDICRRLADGENLRAICRDEGLPNERTVRRWALEDEEFAPQYEKARRIGYHSLFDQMQEIADTPQIGTKTITKANGEIQTIVGDMIEHRRLQVDTRKWMFAKALPKIYGDKLEVDNKHTVVEGPVDILETAKGIAFILNRASAKLDEEGRAAGQGSKVSTTKH
jgi:hypothetical protein